MKLVDMLNEKKRRERKQQQMDTAKKVAIGSVIGAMTGILLAPKSGKETREDIANKSKEAAETTKKSVKESVETMKNVQGKVTEDVKDKLKDFKDRDMFEVELKEKEMEVDKIESDDSIEE